jgi:signal transduction histidine kinase
LRLIGALQELSGARDLAEVTASVGASARAVTRSDGATFVLRDGDRCFYADEDAIAPLWKGQRFPTATCVSGWTMEHRRSAIIDDVYADPRVSQEIYRRTFVKSLVMVPIQATDPIGAIGAYWATNHRVADHELAALEVLAQSASVALRNTDLGRELADAVDSERLARLAAERARLDEQVALDRLQLALDAADIGTWDYNLVSEEALWDSRCRRLFDIQAEMPVDYQLFLSRVHPEDRARTDAAVQRALREGGEFDIEYRTVGPRFGAGRWIAARARAYVDDRGKVVRFIGTAIDISERKARERQLEQAIRLRDEFVTMAAHQLRTPLAALQLEVQGLLGERQEAGGGAGAGGDSVAERLRRMDGQVGRLSTLVADLFDVTRISAGRLDLELESFDLGTVVEESVKRFAERARLVGSELATTVQKPVVVMCDRKRIDQVLSNLLDNAIKYGRGRPVTVSLHGDRERAHVVVKDEGIGIRPEDQRRIFGRFERAVTDPQQTGVGLGLWISRRLAEAHDGTIAFTSVPDVGSTFCLTLPLESPLPDERS